MLNATFHILYIYAIYVFIRPRQVGAITLGIKRVDIGLRFHGGQWPMANRTGSLSCWPSM